VQAEAWLRKAAGQGQADAQRMLDLLFKDGVRIGGAIRAK
jgi:hypothetical protein